jgi:thiosulfate reductase/polysulfide reductase chain A
LDEIASKLKEIKDQYGAESLACGEGTDNTGMQNVQWSFMNQFGSPNMISQGVICWCNTYAIHLTTYGWYMSFHQSPYADSPDKIPKCVIVWGGNYAQSAPAFYKLLLGFSNRGTKLIVIDPRKSELAKRADLWLQLRPATDAALALGMLNVIVNEELYDKQFVNRWCYGFDELKTRVQEYSPERVASITWVSKEKIVNAARMYAKIRPGVITWGVSTDMIGKNSTQAVRAQCVLRAVTGNLDIPGGERMGRTGDLTRIVWSADLEFPEKLSAEQRRKQLGYDRFKLMAFPGWELRADPYQKLYGHLPPLYPTCLECYIEWRSIPCKSINPPST